MTTRTAAEPARRPYHSPARRQQADQTRQRILAAARALFLEAGYAGATLEAIATAAGVSPKTVSAVVGAKRDILAALLDQAAFGSYFQDAHEQFMAASDPRQRLALVARMSRRAYDALAPEFELLRGAPAVASELDDLARQVGARRRFNQTYLVAKLREQGALRDGVTDGEAADVLWTLTGYDLYRALVRDCAWPPDRYEAWLAEVLIERLLAPGGDDRDSGGK